MKLGELHALIEHILKDEKYGELEVTAANGFDKITGIAFCQECNQFHMQIERWDKKDDGGPLRS